MTMNTLSTTMGSATTIWTPAIGLGALRSRRLAPLSEALFDQAVFSLAAYLSDAGPLTRQDVEDHALAFARSDAAHRFADAFRSMKQQTELAALVGENSPFAETGFIARELIRSLRDYASYWGFLEQRTDESYVLTQLGSTMRALPPPSPYTPGIFRQHFDLPVEQLALPVTPFTRRELPSMELRSGYTGVELVVHRNP